MRLKQILEAGVYNLDDYRGKNTMTNYREKLRAASDDVKAAYKKYIDGEIDHYYIPIRNVLNGSTLDPNDPRIKRISAHAPQNVGFGDIMVWKTHASKFLKAVMDDPSSALKKLTKTRQQIMWNPDNISTFWDDMGNRGIEG